MIEQYIMEVGIAGVIIYIVLREVFGFLSKNKSKDCNDWPQLMKLVQELHDMHNQRDSDGVYIWYVRRSLEDAINKLAENVGHQTDAFKELVIQLKTERK